MHTISAQGLFRPAAIVLLGLLVLSLSGASVAGTVQYELILKPVVFHEGDGEFLPDRGGFLLLPVPVKYSSSSRRVELMGGETTATDAWQGEDSDINILSRGQITIPHDYAGSSEVIFDLTSSTLVKEQDALGRMATCIYAALLNERPYGKDRLKVKIVGGPKSALWESLSRTYEWDAEKLRVEGGNIAGFVLRPYRGVLLRCIPEEETGE